MCLTLAPLPCQATDKQQTMLPSLLLAALPLFTVTSAVKHEDFKTCSQSSFCRRLRSIGTRQSESPKSFTSPYSLGEPVAASSGEASWTWPLRSGLYAEINFELRVDVLSEGNGIVRVRADEVDSKTPWKRYNETAKWALINENPPISSSSAVTLSTSKGVDTITYNDGLTLKIERNPFKLTQLRNGKPEIVLNDRSLFHMEHFRIKELEVKEEVMSEGEQMVLKGGEMDRSWFEEHDKDMFEEKFRTWTDSKPKGKLVHRPLHVPANE
jgi:alpha 1,3-glucosidase